MGKRRGYQGDRWERNSHNQSGHANNNFHGHYGSGGGEYDQRRDFSRSSVYNNNRGGYSDHRNRPGAGWRDYRGGGIGRHNVNVACSNTNFYSRTPFHTTTNERSESGGYSNVKREMDFRPDATRHPPPHPEQGPIPGVAVVKKEEPFVATASLEATTAPGINSQYNNVDVKPPAVTACSHASFHGTSATNNGTVPLPKRTKHEQPLSSLNGLYNDDIFVTKENWDSASLIAKLKGQYPFEIINFHIHSLMIEDTPRWFTKKRQAAEVAFEKTKKYMEEKFPQNDDDEEDDIEDNMFDEPNDPYCEVKNFTEALPYNLLVDAGFRLTAEHPDDEKNCFCPCHKQNSKWLATFATGCHIVHDSPDFCDKKAGTKNSPNALMDHLRGHGGFLHMATFYYLEDLYKDFWGLNVGHKALYCSNSEAWRRAVAAQNKSLVDARRYLQAKLDEQHRITETQNRQINELKKLKNINPVLADRKQKLQEDYEAIGIKLEEVEKREKEKEKSSKDYEECRKKTAKLLEMFTTAYESHKRTGKERKLEINVPTNISIQDLFDELYNEAKKDKDGKRDKTFLFRDLSFQSNPTFYNHKILQGWIINIDGCEAIDQGGPTRTFIQEFCTQLPNLAVHVPIEKDRHKSKSGISYMEVESGWNVEFETWDGLRPATVIRKVENKKNPEMYKLRYYDEDEQINEVEVERPGFTVRKRPIKLFEKEANFIFPRQDISFENTMDKMNSGHFYPQMTLEKLKEKAMAFYRAVGRMMLHLIFDPENKMSPTIMPQLLRNYLLLGIRPESDSYDKRDLVEHINEMKNGLVSMHVNKKKKENPDSFWHYFDEDLGLGPFSGDEKITKDNFSRKFIPLYLLETRHETLDAMKEGLTLGGTFDITNIFHKLPLDFVNKFLFSNPAYSVETIVGLITKDENEDDSNLPEELKAGRHQFLNETLPEVLRTLSAKDAEFPSMFLYFVTGSSLMPHLEGNPGYRIKVGFNQHAPEDNWPTAATCDNLLTVPFLHYKNNVGIFQDKLERSVGLGNKSGFQME